MSRSVATILIKFHPKARYSSAFLVKIFVYDYKIFNQHPYQNTLQFVAFRDDLV